MAKRKSRKSTKRPKQPDELKFFQKLGDFVAEAAQGEMRKGRFFSLCLRASFGKCYEFNLHAWDENNTESAFYWLPTLRGVCEDLIVLNYIQGIPHAQRETLVTGLMRHELHVRLMTQVEFFKNTKPQQPILKPFMTADQVDDLETEIRDVWRAHGWPNMNRKVMPPTRQMAEKHGGDILATLYDYLYRLTSATVHFNVGGLLRTGWGDMLHATFSPKHFNRYYTMFGRVYGAYMFCAYFELFARFLRTNAETKEPVAEIRQALLRLPRWPEMVTFEEMNIKPPEIELIQTMVSFIQAETEKRLLKK